MTPAEIETAAREFVTDDLAYRAGMLRRAVRDDQLPQLNADECAIRTRAAELYDALAPAAPGIWDGRGDDRG